MSESELGGFIQVAPYPLEAVPYQLFAKMIGRKESTVRTMIDAAKLFAVLSNGIFSPLVPSSRKPRF